MSCSRYLHTIMLTLGYLRPLNNFATLKVVVLKIFCLKLFILNVVINSNEQFYF